MQPIEKSPIKAKDLDVSSKRIVYESYVDGIKYVSTNIAEYEYFDRWLHIPVSAPAMKMYMGTYNSLRDLFDDARYVILEDWSWVENQGIKDSICIRSFIAKQPEAFEYAPPRYYHDPDTVESYA